MFDWEEEINSWDHITPLEESIEAPELEYIRPKKKAGQNLDRKGNLTRYTTYTYIFAPEDAEPDTVVTTQVLLINEWKDITVEEMAHIVQRDKKRKGLDNDGVGVV